METIKCVAVDDEAPALRVIEQYITRNNMLTLVAKFHNPIDAAAWLKNNYCHILFLDVSMPQQSGVAMLQSLQRKPITIFTTAYSEFAVDAFDLDAADYLRKPFTYDRFMKAVDKANDYLQLDGQKKGELVLSSEQGNFISFKADGKHVKVFFSEIVYIEAFQEYVKIFTDTARYITYERIKNLESILPEQTFMRVHRSYIVALDRIKKISGKFIEIDNYQIPISRGLKNELFKKVF
jgi:DNA-binding LytR/AlgR family response regulator